MSRAEILLPDPDLSMAPEPEGPQSPAAAALVAAVQGCNVAVSHCVRLGGRLADPAHLGRFVDGIGVGQTAAELEQRGSPLLPAQLEVCAAAFGRVAEACARFPEDPVLAWCGQTCGSAASALSA